jgi:hypothetical protein
MYLLRNKNRSFVKYKTNKEHITEIPVGPIKLRNQYFSHGLFFLFRKEQVTGAPLYNWKVSVYQTYQMKDLKQNFIINYTEFFGNEFLSPAAISKASE